MYDTLIIGAGLSGLAAGIRLAYFEKRVGILERHTTIGGLNSFYRLRSRNHDVGLHAVTNYAPPGTKTGPLSRILRQLRLRWDDFDLAPQIESSIVFPERTLRFNNDSEFFRQQVVEQFPDQADRFAALVRRIDEHDVLDVNQPELSARAVLGETLTDPLLIEMLLCPVLFYGSPTPNDIDFTFFVILFRSIFQEGFGRPYHGVRQILKQLVRKYKSLGGELLLRSGVREIVSENGRTTGVVLDDGRELETENVLSSAGAAETMRLCRHAAPPNPKDYRPGNISFVETISILDRHPSQLPLNQTVVFYNHTDGFRYECPSGLIDTGSGIVCSPNNYRYDRPLEEGRIRVTALANPAAWMDLPEEEYAAQKARCYEQIVESALRSVPDFRPHTIDADLFTPRTIRKFTGHVNGCVYGAPKKRRDGRTHLENLYLCGTDQGLLGITGAMLSGITIANQYLLK